MRNVRYLFVVLFGIAVVFVFSSKILTSQASEESKSSPIEIKGCLRAGVEAGCLILTTANGTGYSLHGNNLPGLDKKLVASVKGTEGGIDHCQEGTVFQVSSWNWTRMRCKREAQPQPKSETK